MQFDIFRKSVSLFVSTGRQMRAALIPSSMIYILQTNARDRVFSPDSTVWYGLYYIYKKIIYKNIYILRGGGERLGVGEKKVP